MKLMILLSFFLCSQSWASWSVATYNIRNFDKDSGTVTNHTELGKIIQSVKSDVMAFEEVVNVEGFKHLIKKNLPGYLVRVSSCGGSGKQKLAVIYNPKTFRFVSETEDLSFSGSQSSGCGSLRPVFFVTLAHRASQEEYVFGVVHLKAGGDGRSMKKRWQQYKKLGQAAVANEETNLILLGDFNTTGYAQQDEDYNKFEAFMSKARLKSMSEQIGCTSYWDGGQNTGNYQSSILDHIVLQEYLADSIQEVYLGAHCAEQECRPGTAEDLGVSFKSVSDHCPIQVIFE